MAHSCVPNASWYTSDTLGTRVVRSLVPIGAGEEVFVSYLSGSDLLLPTETRRSLLQAQKEFLCQCQRCCAHEDEARVFPCTFSAKCPGTHCSLTGGGLGPCSLCHAPISNSDAAISLAQEAGLLASLDRIDHILDAGLPVNVSAAIQALEPIHPLHYLSRRIGRVQYELHTQR
ncbi:unnamed protein product, partial [Polarella glacialis]